jgi:SnoaL-like polyketide cyclase
MPSARWSCLPCVAGCAGQRTTLDDASIARFTGTMKGPMKGPDGREIPPTAKSFEVDFCTVARRANGEIVEENLFYDVVNLMRQIGVGG